MPSCNSVVETSLANMNIKAEAFSPTSDTDSMKQFDFNGTPRSDDGAAAFGTGAGAGAGGPFVTQLSPYPYTRGAAGAPYVLNYGSNPTGLQLQLSGAAVGGPVIAQTNYGATVNQSQVGARGYQLAAAQHPSSYAASFASAAPASSGYTSPVRAEFNTQTQLLGAGQPQQQQWGNGALWQAAVEGQLIQPAGELAVPFFPDLETVAHQNDDLIAYCTANLQRTCSALSLSLQVSTVYVLVLYIACTRQYNTRKYCTCLKNTRPYYSIMHIKIIIYSTILYSLHSTLYSEICVQ